MAERLTSRIRSGRPCRGRDRWGHVGLGRRQGFFDSFKEVGALAKHLSDARQTSETPLIKELAEVRGTGFGFKTSPEEVESETTEALRSPVATLKAKAPDEVQSYRNFVLGVAKSVAAAADDIGAPETDALGKIEAALRTA